jgi:hypothetical protein
VCQHIARPPGEWLLFQVTYRERYDTITRCAALLSILRVPYEFRHSGASHRRLRNLCALAGVPVRGRWRSLESVGHHERHASAAIVFR